MDKEINQYKKKFEEKILRTNQCFYWTGTIDKSSGRGRFRIGKLNKNVTVLAWELANQESVPEGLVIKHTCEVLLCVRPDHLFLGKRGYPWLT